MVLPREALPGSAGPVADWSGVSRRLSRPRFRRRGAVAPSAEPAAGENRRRQWYDAAIARARAAADAGDWSSVLDICSALAVEYPGEVLPLIGKSAALWELGQPDPAEAILREAAERFSQDPLPAIYYGMLAVRRSDWPEVLRRAQALRRRFPALLEAQLGVGEALRQLGRLEEAEPIIAAANARFRRTIWPGIYHALVAESRGQWPEALRRWNRVRRRFPRQPEGYLGAAELQVKLGKTEAADRTLRRAMARFSHRRELAVKLAAAAQRWQRWTVAAELWRIVRRNFPDEPAGYLRAAEMLQRAGQLAEADAVLQGALECLPGCDAAWVAAIELALERQDRGAALRRWREFVRRCPPADHDDGLARRLELRRRLALSDPGLRLDTGLWLPGTVLSEDPVIILSAGEVFEVAENVAAYYQGRPVYCFSGMLWTVSRDPNYRLRFKQSFERLSAQYPDFRIIVLANDVAELLAVRELGIPAELVNHNAFIDDSVFDILPVKQTFDAVYNARPAGYKRHELAAGIDKLKLIVTSAEAEGLARLKDLLPGCTIANEEDGATVHLTSKQVAYHLNTAKCGLCLSELEGAMFASAEYLLCGLPVVTTRNAGGRNWLFSTEYVVFVEDSEIAVADAVEQIRRETVSRRLVRESAREKIRRERLVFFDLVNRIFRENGQESRHIETEFEARFCDKINYVGRQLSEFLVP